MKHGRYISSIDYKKYFILLLLIICIFVVARTIVFSVHNGGWRKTFDSEISQQNASPKDFHSLTLHEKNLFIGTIGGFTYALDRTNGRLHWQHEAYDYSIYPAAFGNDNLVFLTNFDGRVYALDQTSGKEVWNFTTPDFYKADTEPVVSDGFVYFGSRNGALYALDQKTGSVLWTSQSAPIDLTRYTPDQIYLHFGRFTVDDTNIYLNSATEDTIRALDKKTGRENWSFRKYGFRFQKPTILHRSISFWNDRDIYYILSQTNGSILYSAHAPYEKVFQNTVRSYVINSLNQVESVQTENGTKNWAYQEVNLQPIYVKEISPSHVAITGKINELAVIVILNAETGKMLWSKTMDQQQIKSVLSDENRVYVIGNTKQCAFDFDGNIVWCTNENQNSTTSLLSNDGIYLISKDEKDTSIYFINKNTGRRKWLYRSGDINSETIQVHEGDLYFVSMDKRYVYMLNSNYSQSLMNEKDIQTISNKKTFISQICDHVRNLFLQTQSLLSFNKNPRDTMTVHEPVNPVKKNTVCEFTIQYNSPFSKNSYDAANITGIFTFDKKVRYDIKAFYFDKHTRKIRFNPPESGTWNFLFRDDATGTTFHEGSFEVIDSDIQGFISISKEDPRLFVEQNGSIFTPIGIQDCVRDINQDGNALNQWFAGTEARPYANKPFYSATTMESYLSLYGQSGFNTFRWGVNNCNYFLWKTLSVEGNRYAINESVQLDLLYTSLREHGFHIWMSLFSFSLPFDTAVPAKQKESVLKHYLDYIVARYSAYVDVWELANEIYLDEPLINFMSNYIRTIDPYGHPITTSWERPDLSTIEITSFHWYAPECNEFCDDIQFQIGKYQNIQKPIVFSEFGNWFSNWDEYSAERMRVRLWIGYFKKIYPIYWNTSSTLYINNQGTIYGPSNIYIGPEERLFVSIFNNFIADNEDSLLPYSLITKTREDNAFGFKTNNQIQGYIYRKIINAPTKPTYIFLSVPDEGIIQWINPVSGNVVSSQSIFPGEQTITSPQFSTDIAFKIKY